jgi:hypothetical protein
MLFYVSVIAVNANKMFNKLIWKTVGNYDENINGTVKLQGN